MICISGAEDISRTRMVAHELSHVATKKDDNGNPMDLNIKAEFGTYIVFNWENPIMIDIDGHIRVSYFYYSTFRSIYTDVGIDIK